MISDENSAGGKRQEPVVRKAMRIHIVGDLLDPDGGCEAKLSETLPKKG